MRIQLFAAAAALSLLAGSASAAVTISTGSFGSKDGLHTDAGGDSATETGVFGDGFHATLTTSGDLMTVGGGSGESSYADGPEAGLFTDLLITLEKSYRKITFNLDTLKKTDTAFTVLVNGADLFSEGSLGPGENKYTLFATGGDFIHTLAFTFTPAIQDIKQIRVAEIAGAVPEPTSWALMIVGFGLAGAVLRRRRAQQRALARSAMV